MNYFVLIGNMTNYVYHLSSLYICSEFVICYHHCCHSSQIFDDVLDDFHLNFNPESIATCMQDKTRDYTQERLFDPTDKFYTNKHYL
jgi:hypothetical protein